MRITKSQLRQIIKEELQNSMQEGDPQVDYKTGIAANMQGASPGTPGKKVTGSELEALHWLQDWGGIDQSEFFDDVMQSLIEDTLYQYSGYIQMEAPDKTYEDLQRDWSGNARYIAALAGEPVNVPGNLEGFKMLIQSVEDLADAESGTSAEKAPGSTAPPYTKNKPYTFGKDDYLPNDVNIDSDDRWAYQVKIRATGNWAGWSDYLTHDQLKREIPFMRGSLEIGNIIAIVGDEGASDDRDAYGWIIPSLEFLDRFFKGRSGFGPAAAKPQTGSRSREVDAAVREFQRLVGTPDDGIWGPNTQSAWKKYVESYIFTTNKEVDDDNLISKWSVESPKITNVNGEEKSYTPDIFGALQFAKDIKAGGQPVGTFSLEDSPPEGSAASATNETLLRWNKLAGLLKD